MGITMYYNGFIRNPLNGSTFLEYSCKSPMPPSSWMDGQPNNYGNSQNCVTNVMNNGLNDLECTTALNPVCQVQLNTHFQLTGIPQSVFADIYYSLGEVRGFESQTLSLIMFCRIKYFMDTPLLKCHGQDKIRDGNCLIKGSRNCQLPISHHFYRSCQ